jgi:hypothetical protein
MSLLTKSTQTKYVPLADTIISVKVINDNKNFNSDDDDDDVGEDCWGCCCLMLWYILLLFLSIFFFTDVFKKQT